MPSERSVDQSCGITTVKMWGAVYGREVAAAIEGIYQDPRWNAGFAIISDLREITEVFLEAADFSTFVQIHRRYEDRAPRAEIVIVRRQMEQMMSRLYVVFMRGAKHKVRVCRSLREAMTLLSE